MVTSVSEEQKKTKVSRLDQFHKMGRQVQAYLAMFIASILILKGHDISAIEALLIGGPATVYTLTKGKGQ